MRIRLGTFEFSLKKKKSGQEASGQSLTAVADFAGVVVKAYSEILYSYSSILCRYEDAVLCMSILLFQTASSEEVYICATDSLGCQW